MNLQEIVNKLNLHILTTNKTLDQIEPNGGYTSDLLSCVMTGAKTNNVWVTLQSHMNIVAVAALLDLAAIIITENAQPDQETIQKAEQQGVTLLLSQSTSYEVIGKLWEMGIKA